MTQRAAPLGRRLRGATWALALGGCLVTEKVDYTVENAPPSINAMTPSAITRIPEQPPLLCGTRAGIELTLSVRDADIDDDLRVRVSVNRELLVEAGKTIPRSGSAERKTLTWCVPANPRDFTNACNLLEVFVSSEFATENNDFTPKLPGDVASAQLLVLAKVSDEPGASADDCIPILADLDRLAAVAAAEADAGS